MGIESTEEEWFRSHILNRQNTAHSKVTSRAPRPVTFGMPQGSCLGSMLYVLILNDFETCLKFSKANLYADDTGVSSHVIKLSSNELENMIRNFQAELDNVSE